MSTAPITRGMVLAAGRGSRLRPITDVIPKPGVPFFGRPMIDLAIDNLCSVGVRNVHVNVWHLPEQLRCTVEERDDLDQLIVHEEKELLGTAGGIRNAFGPEPDGDVWVHNGDVCFLGDLPRLLAQHRATGALATLGLIRCEDPTIPRSVIVDSAYRVVDFGKGAPEDSWTFVGIHILSDALFQHIPSRGCIVADVYRKLLSTGRIQGVPLHGTFGDLGTIERYLHMYKELMDRPTDLFKIRPDLASLQGQPALVHSDSSIAASASLQGPVVIESGVRIDEGAQVGPYAYLGKGAHICPNIRVQDAVVFGGCVVDQTLENGVVVDSIGVVNLDRPEQPPQ
ncbi:MAG: hypothetical protein CMH54_03610 [Myxococcales bacterium]|nr:hypothetical protein [Myxococcales bacterium]